MHSLYMLRSANSEGAWIRRRLRLNRRSGPRQNEIVPEMSEMEFLNRFRIDKRTFRLLCADLRNLGSLKGTREIPLEVKASILKFCVIFLLLT